MTETTTREYLERLKRAGAEAVKFSTEDEGLCDRALVDRIAVVGDALPIHLKIGGPNARGDIVFAVRHDLAGIVAPMVETPYAAAAFGRAALSVPGGERLEWAVNLETRAAAEAVGEILAALPDRVRPS